jgi:L-malate glycosyltransferase
MRILLLSNSASEHTQKWAKGLVHLGVEVGVFSLNRADIDWSKNQEGISILHEPAIDTNNKKLASKVGYLSYVKELKKNIEAFKPDILHAHYATSYGLLGKLSKFTPFVISVWGSDVYDFPAKSHLHKLIVKNILSKADAICSTSESMKVETRKYTNKPIEVIPFGIEPAYFEVEKKQRNTITIGLVKSLESKYGIDVLIKAFEKILKKYPEKNITLLLVGDGSKMDEYIQLASSLGIADKVIFKGRVPHEEVINYHASIDIFVSLSVLDSESFGVSLVEAMAMATPVVASDVSGFKEVLGENPCGLVVARNSVDEAVDAISTYIDKPDFAIEMGKRAKVRAKQMYSWTNNIKSMYKVYASLLDQNE